MKKIKSFLFLIPGIFAALIYFVLPFFPNIAEYVFARGIFRVLSTVLSFITGYIPFSLTELLVVLALPLFVFAVILFIKRMKKSKNRRQTAAKAGKAAGWVISSTLLVYMLMHGANFYRFPVAELMELPQADYSQEFLVKVVKDLIRQGAAAKAEIAVDEKGSLKLSATVPEMLSAGSFGYDKLGEKYDFFKYGAPNGKGVILSRYWSYTGITGMYFPFWCEANVNIDIPKISIPVTAAHELAHTKGFAREDEANFIAFLACAESDNPEIRYSGYYLAIRYFMDIIGEYNTEATDKLYYEAYEVIQTEVVETAEYYSEKEGEVMAVSSAVNDSFIKAQGVPEGTVSYSKMAELILRYYKNMENNGLF